MTANGKAKRRLRELRARMAQADAQLVALGPGPHMDWLLGFVPHPDERPCLLLISESKEVFLMPALNAESAREKTDITMHCWADAQGPGKALKEAVADVTSAAVRKVIVDEGMRAHFALLLLGELPDAQHDFTEATLGELRMRKDADEHEQIAMNASIADQVMQSALAALRPGITEADLAEIISTSFTQAGAKPLFAIVAAGHNSAFPHHEPGSRRLDDGDVVVIDLGGSKGAFSSDITRMAVVGAPPEGYADIHAVVEEACRSALEAARPGALAKDVDAAARDVICAAGYGEYFVHRTGHGLGIEVHELPNISASSQTVLDENMVFSIEPGIYLPGRFGIRLEEIVILRENKAEVLSQLPREVHIAQC